MVKASAKGCWLRVWPMPSSKKIPAFFAVRLSRGKGAWFVFFIKSSKFLPPKKVPRILRDFWFFTRLRLFVQDIFEVANKRWVKVSLSWFLVKAHQEAGHLRDGILCLPALAPINRLLKIGRQGWFTNSRGTTLYLLVHVQFGHDINFTVALKNLNFSKDQTLGPFWRFLDLSAYIRFESISPFGIFVRDARKSQPKIWLMDQPFTKQFWLHSPLLWNSTSFWMRPAPQLKYQVDPGGLVGTFLSL